MADEKDQTEQQETQPAAEDGNGDFGAAFAERSADPAKLDAKAEDEEKSSSAQEPAEEAGSQEAPADDAATGDDTSGPAQEADPWKDLTPEQLRERLKETTAERDKFQASDRSNRGRVGALTKKLNTLQSQAKAPEKAPEQTEDKGKADEGKSGEDGAESSASDLDKKLQQAAEEYGDVVGPITEVLKEVRAEIADLKKAPATREEIDADAEKLTTALADLEKVHPDLDQHGPGSDFDRWLGEQPPKVAELANSYDPREVSLALTLFKTERSAAIAKQSGDEREDGSQQAEEQGKQDRTATDDKRKRQLDGSRQVPGKGQPSAAGVPNDFSSAFRARAQDKATG